MLDLGFLPDIEKLLAVLPAPAPDDALLGHDAGPDRRAGAQVPRPADPDPRRAAAPTMHRDRARRPVRLPRPRDGQDRGARPRPAGPRARPDDDLHPHEAHRRQKVADDLLDRGFAAAAVHGDLGQGAREQALRAFRSGKVDVLVATDVAARGLDVEGVTHVINYQAPEDDKNYVHRIGRTARAGASGTAITLVDWDELPRWRLICDTLGLPFHEPPETYSTSPAPVPRTRHPGRRRADAAPGRAHAGRPGRRTGRRPRRARGEAANAAGSPPRAGRATACRRNADRPDRPHRARDGVPAWPAGRPGGGTPSKRPAQPTGR